MIKSSVMKKSITIICVLFALLAGNLPVSAQYVTQEAAREKANAFLKRTANSQSAARKAPRKAPVLTLANNRDEFYVFNDEANGGYVVISGEERMPDVLAYSYDSHFDADNMPCNMQAWMDDCAAQVRWLREHPEVAAERRKSPQRADIAPMLTCKFNQGEPYNLKCPKVDGEHCVTGCTATAMAQIMHYWQWPKKTTFTIPAYTTGTLKIEMPAIPPTTIDWDNILEEYWFEYSQEQTDAIATLMALCGTAVNMDYTLGASGAGVSPGSYDLLDYDICSMQLEARMYYSDADWEEMLYNELQQRRPIEYFGGSSSDGSHVFVIDGYQYLDETAYWHVNWGWGGGYIVAGPYYDQQYYTLDNMGFNYYQHALIGIQPASNGRLYIVDEADGKATLYYDLEAGNKGDKARPWNGFGKDVTEVELHPSVANCKPKSLPLFAGCNNLKQIKGIEYLNTEEMTDMSFMFDDCSNLTSLDVSGFKTDKVTDMSLMFSDCKNLTSLDVSGFNTENVTRIYLMFSGCSNLTSLDVSGFKTDKVTDMSWMFYDCSNLTSLDVSGFKTDNVTDMRWMFDRCSNLTSLDVSGFKTDKVTDMSNMFYGCSNLTSLDVSGFNTDKVTDMSNMFYGCSNLTSLDVSGFNTDKVTDMSGMFGRSSSLTSLDVSGFKTDKVTDMRWMFDRCSNLTSLDVSGFKTDKVTDMSYMFYGCSNLTSLDVSGFNTDKVTDMSGMFAYCSNLTTIYASKSWDMSSVTSSDYMFYNCPNLVGGAGTTFDWSHTNGEYARIDEGASNPGYLTYKVSTEIASPELLGAKQSGVYNLGGAKVRSAQEGANGLPSGLYIVNKKKILVK